MTRARFFGFVVLAVISGATALQAAPFVYLRSTAGQPWGQNTNELAMDAAFGVGQWDDSRFETVAVGTLFSPATQFIFMEGGDFTANELEGFLGSNQAAIEAWVSAGGSLFVNAAPNEGDGMSLGFGGALLNYSDLSGAATAVNGAHPIFNGPQTPVGTNFTGTFFSHANISGGGFASLINDDTGDSVLAGGGFGLGYVLFGGMTTTNFHDPDPNAFNLRVNILDFGANQAQAAAVPEPASIALWTLLGIGGAGCGLRRWRKRRQPAA